MPTRYCGRTNNRNPKPQRPGPPRFKTLFQLTDEYLQTALGSEAAREALVVLAGRICGQ